MYKQIKYYCAHFSFRRINIFFAALYISPQPRVMIRSPGFAMSDTWSAISSKVLNQTAPGIFSHSWDVCILYVLTSLEPIISLSTTIFCGREHRGKIVQQICRAGKCKRLEHRYYAVITHFLKRLKRNLNARQGDARNRLLQ